MEEDDTGKDSSKLLHEERKQRGMKATNTFYSVKDKMKQKRGTLCPEFISLKGERVVDYSNVPVLVPIEF